MILTMPQRISSAGQNRANSLPQLYKGRTPNVKWRRKITPMTMSTSGPASERGGRGGLIGGTGGGACIVLTIFHLAVDLSRRLLLRRYICSRRNCGWRSAQITTFHQLDDTQDQKNDWPGAVPARTVQIIQ